MLTAIRRCAGGRRGDFKPALAIRVRDVGGGEDAAPGLVAVEAVSWSTRSRRAPSWRLECVQLSSRWSQDVLARPENKRRGWVAVTDLFVE